MFWPESAYGPTNQCIGLADILRGRGHTIVFAAESSWAGKLAPLGFIEELVDLAEPADGAAEEDAGKFWTDYITETAPEFRKPTIQQLDTFIKPTYQALIDGAKYCEPRLRDIIARHRPDVIVEDNVVLFPALVTAGVPFVRIVSCSPLEVSGAGVPPPFSGLPSADDAEWAQYRAEYDRTHRATWADFDAWVRQQGADPLPDLEFMPRTNAANLYVYPAEADYRDARPLDPSWTRMDSSVRETDEEYVLPAEVADRPTPARGRAALWPLPPTLRRRAHRDRKSVGEGKSVDLGGRRIIKKKKSAPPGTGSSSAKDRRPIESGWRTTWSARRCCRRPR